MQTISRDIPLAELTIRKYEKPNGLNKRELVKKLCLSTGLLQPGDSRDIIVDILYALLDAKRKKNELTSEQIRERIIESRKELNLPLNGIASSNVRRQVKRLRDLFLVEKIKNKYRINEHEELSRIFEEKIELYLVQTILSRIKEYFSVVDNEF